MCRALTHIIQKNDTFEWKENEFTEARNWRAQFTLHNMYSEAMSWEEKMMENGDKVILNFICKWNREKLHRQALFAYIAWRWWWYAFQIEWAIMEISFPIYIHAWLTLSRNGLSVNSYKTKKKHPLNHWHATFLHFLSSHKDKPRENSPI